MTTSSTSYSRARLRHANARPVARTHAEDANPSSGGCVIEAGTATRTTRGERWASWPTQGRRPCRALSGGSPEGRAAARSAGPRPQVGGTRRHAAPMTAPAKTGPGPSSVPGILSPRKITAPIGWTGQSEANLILYTSCPFGLLTRHKDLHLLGLIIRQSFSLPLYRVLSL